MEKAKYFKLVKEIKADLVKEGYCRFYTRLYSDKRSPKNNGYRTKLFGISSTAMSSSVEFVKSKYGKDVSVECINSRVGGPRRGYTIPSLVIRPLVLVK